MQRFYGLLERYIYLLGILYLLWNTRLLLFVSILSLQSYFKKYSKMLIRVSWPLR